LGTTVTDQTFLQKEVNRRLTSENACYCSVQNLLSSCLPTKNVEITIYDTIIFPLILYGCENRSVTLRQEHRLKVFENGVQRTIFEPRRDEVTEGWRMLHSKEGCDLYPSPIRIIRSRRIRWAK
jgi:hypothetical protein